MNLYHKIQDLEKRPLLSKHECLVNGIISSIDDRSLTYGDVLPSVNKMVHELGYARKTIVKAYEELKERGIVSSKRRMGYFVASEATEQKLKVAILLYAFQTFQERFFNTFRENLGENIHLDVYFHHQNSDVYRSILKEINGKYGMYVVAPIQDQSYQELFNDIPFSKILFVDRFVPLGAQYSYIVQEFERSFYKALYELSETLSHFSECILIYKSGSDYPKGTLLAFQKYCEDFGVKSKIIPKYLPGSLQEKAVYFTIGDTDLWEILKDCKRYGVEVGTEVGILSQNDSPVKELIEGGISTFSTDFMEMAKMAARFVCDREPVRVVIPSVLIRRKSL
ncbi:MAG: GntR family transcriptional regulator [Bacteroidota bacterium]